MRKRASAPTPATTSWATSTPTTRRRAHSRSTAPASTCCGSASPASKARSTRSNSAAAPISRTEMEAMMRMTSKTGILACALMLAAGFEATARADDLSTSVMRPTPVDPATGLVAGKLPGGQGSRSYYVALDLQAGDLVAQLQVMGTRNTGKRIDFDLLDASARVSSSMYAMADLDAKAEATKTFPIDHAGRYVVRLTAEGGESGSYCVLMGGTALPSAKATGCPVATAPPAPVAIAPPPSVTPAPEPVAAPAPVVAPAPPPVVAEAPVRVPDISTPPRQIEVLSSPPRAIEVITSKCEERLRVGADFLFDFDRSELRPEAEPALGELARRI